MNIYMTGIDFNKASIEHREHFALTKTAQAAMLVKIRSTKEILGCVIINTCNRMELWLNYVGEPEKLPFELLCELFGAEASEYESYFTHRAAEEAVHHLFELACGLKSLIFGEEQILTQVKEAIGLARDCKTSDPILEALFQRAVTAAKKAKTNVNLVAVDRSVASATIQILKEKYGQLEGLSCLVIGSGEMGKLTAKGLVSEGCDVHITLRQYRSGEAIIPAGCKVVDYDNRFSMLRSSKVIISATRSPHYTLLYDQVSDLIAEQEKLMFDLAVPRDIDPNLNKLPNISLYDIDHLGGNLAQEVNNQAVAQVKAIIEEEISEFERWNCVRVLMPRISEISAEASADVEARIRRSLKNTHLDDDCRKLVHEAASTAVNKVVENILLSLNKNATSEIVSSCLTEIKQKASAAATSDFARPLPPRFPLFVDLTGKKVSVIGAGPIAMRRIKTLLSYPCSVQVTATRALDEIAVLHENRSIVYTKKSYDAADIEDSFLVIAATDNRELNNRIAQDAELNGQYCSIADCKEECTFFFPSTVHYDGGVIGICGTGENHRRTKDVASDIRALMKAREQK